MATVKCSQCDTPAMVTISNNPLCVDHWLKFQQATQIQGNREIEYLNYLSDQAELAVGLYGVLPRIKVTKPVIHQGTMNFQNIKIDKSNIGVLNTGEIGKLEAVMNVIEKDGNSELKNAIKEFTQAVIDAKEVDAKIKNEIVDKISFLATQATALKENRMLSVVKTVIESIKVALTATEALPTLMTLWDKLVVLFAVAIDIKLRPFNTCNQLNIKSL